MVDIIMMTNNTQIMSYFYPLCYHGNPPWVHEYGVRSWIWVTGFKDISAPTGFTNTYFLSPEKAKCITKL